MFDEFQGGRIGRRCCVTVIANLNNFGQWSAVLTAGARWEFLVFNLSHKCPIFYIFLPFSGTHTAQFRLKYCLNEQIIQTINQATEERYVLRS